MSNLAPYNGRMDNNCTGCNVVGVSESVVQLLFKLQPFSLSPSFSLTSFSPNDSKTAFAITGQVADDVVSFVFNNFKSC